MNECVRFFNKRNMSSPTYYAYHKSTSNFKSSYLPSQVNAPVLDSFVGLETNSDGRVKALHQRPRSRAEDERRRSQLREQLRRILTTDGRGTKCKERERERGKFKTLIEFTGVDIALHRPPFPHGANWK